MFAYINSFKYRRYYFFNTRNNRFKNMDRRVDGNNEWRDLEKNKKLDLSSNWK
jgi:hypothetical protein